MTFCGAGGFLAISASEATLSKFVAFLAESGLIHPTIKVPISGMPSSHQSETRLLQASQGSSIYCRESIGQNREGSGKVGEAT